jgi:membrane fusion protein, multidrug efflux system
MQLDRKTIRRRRNLLLLLVVFVLSAGGLAYAVNWWLYGRFWVVTDNAFVTGNLIPVHADATGIVAQVLVEETQLVKRGDLVIRLDAQRAGAALGQAEGELGRAVRAVGALFATRQQMCQRILSRAALLDKVRHDIIRYRQALPSGSVAKQILQNAEDQKASLEADLKEARAEFQSIDARVGDTSRTNHPEIEVARNKFTDAYIEYARQQIPAPVTGYIAKRKAQVGDRIRPGDQVMIIVPLDHLWVEANLWESSLRSVRPSQPALITVDLYGRSYTYHGTVEGLVPGTGSVFALLPRTTRQAISFISSSVCLCALDCARTRS